jgi:hypothetical protein
VTAQMFEPLFVWLESTASSVWLRESLSLLALPGILAVHTVGLGFVAGLSGAFDLRLLGVGQRIPPTAFRRFLPVIWTGLWVNILTGIALVLAYPTKALTNPVFYLKLGLIAAALVIFRALLRRADDGRTEAGATKMLAATSLVVWAAAITAGRLLAYTCTRLTVDQVCR